MITLEQAKNLTHGTVLYHVNNRNSDGTPQRWRVSGKPKVWKTRPDEVSVPVKYGLYQNDHLTHDSLGQVCLSELEALKEFTDLLTTAADTVAKLKDMAPAEYYSDLKKVLKSFDMIQMKVHG